MLTVDANVFVSAYQRLEVQYTDSDLFLKRAVQTGSQFYCPILVLPETAAAIVKPTGNVALARLAVTQIQQFPGISLTPLTENRALQAAELAILHRLRGADAVYVAMTQEFGTTLITWDNEVLKRGLSAFAVMTPTDWLTANPI